MSQSYHESGVLRNDFISDQLHTDSNALRIASNKYNRHAIYACLEMFALPLKLTELLETLRKSLLNHQKGGCLTSLKFRIISEMTLIDNR